MTGNKIFKYVVFDTLRSKLTLIYSILFFTLGFSIFFLGQDNAKALITLLNVVLLIVPLVSIIIGTIHFYNSREFIELLLAQPIHRKTIFWGEYAGLSVSLAISFLIGLGIPILIYGISWTGLFLLLVGTLLSFCFVALAFLSSVLNNDKAKGIGASILLWFYLAVVYDGIVLLVLFLFNDYSLEKVILLLTMLNPIDIGRITVLLKMDISALMGVTGALFQQFFGSITGIFMAFSMMFVWILAPILLALRIFKKKDF